MTVSFTFRLFRDFADLASHPWVVGVAQAICGPKYEIVEIAFDTPFQSAKNQPWHRDFPSPPETYGERRITSLAFNLTGVDVTADMGPFEIAPGAGHATPHDMMVTQVYFDTLPKSVREHPVCRAVDQLVPVKQKHDIEGLVMGAE